MKTADTGSTRERGVALVVFAVASIVLFFLMARAARTVGGVAIGTLLAATAALALAWALQPPRPWRASGGGDSGGVPRIDWTGLLWPLVLGVVLCVPTMGIMGLWDPWETHYGEVAREILARDDWISLWWQDEWFNSKPIFLFWVTAWSMGVLGTSYHADGQPSAPEWAVRLPTTALSILLVLVVARTARRYFGPRAGFLSALVLATTPYFSFLSHQAITDMPFVATMMIAVCALVVAIHTDPDEPAHGFRVPWRGGAREGTTMHLVVAAFVLSAWPQILYLVTRNLTVGGPGGGLSIHGDVFFSGSAENTPLRAEEPAFLHPQPAAQALIWLALFAPWLLAARKRTTQQAALLYTFFLLVSLSTMAKGIPGFALPGLVALVFLVVTGRWSLLRRLQIPTGIVGAAVVLLPWFVAMYVRHGPSFTNRLLVHDHVNRLLVGVHGDVGTVQYFLEQLGYGMFPWVALAPAALLSFVSLRRAALTTETGEARLAFSLTALLSFVLFSAMVTKFHHYIFPMVPPLALLVAVFLDEVTPADERVVFPPRGVRLGWFAAAAVWPALAVWAVATALHEDTRLAGTLVASGLSLAATAALVFLARKADLLSQPPAAGVRPANHGGPTVTVALVGAALLAGFVGSDLARVRPPRPTGDERLVRLFIYNYDRAFPGGLTWFNATLPAFGVVAVVVLAAFAMPRLRRAALHVLAGFSVVFAAWVVYVYMWQLTPHWSQRDFIATYYRERASPEERLVAWQMNWKGENFYTGNRVIVYVSLDNDAFLGWVEDHRGERVFVCTERARLDSLRRVLQKSATEAPVVDGSNNKYIMIRTTL